MASLFKSIETAAKTLKRDFRYLRSFSASSKRKLVGRFNCSLKDAYFATTEKGIYLLQDGNIYHICNIPCYGIAFSKDDFFLTAWFKNRSVLLKGNRMALHEPSLPFRFRSLYSLDGIRSNERLHQAFCSDTSLWVANTGRNTILQFDLSNTNALQRELPLFYDSFSEPILYDNHHINSVSEYNGLVLYVAYGASHGSIIGVIEGNRTVGFSYKHMGVHDIFLTDNNFIFCDTFANKAFETYGMVLDREGPIDEAFFKKTRQFPRGVAGDQEELLVGSSFEGEGKQRFRGKGSLLVLRDRKVVDTIAMPAAQVYQIVTLGGQYLRPPSNNVDFSNVHGLFENSLGEPIYEAALRSLPTGYWPHKAFPQKSKEIELSNVRSRY